MKSVLTLFLALCSLPLFGQKSEDLVPKEAISVFSINNVNLLQKISLDDLVKYEFMEEVQQELFDGSTAGKTLKESGIDFDQKLNVFSGKTIEYEITGLTFGVTDRNQLFSVFDDYQPTESEYAGVDMYVSYFNRIALKGNSGILFRINPDMSVVDEITDSIWYARGNEYPWYNDEFEEFYEELEEIQHSEEIEFMHEMETEEHTVNPIDELPVASDDPSEKTYYELRDSVEMILQIMYLDEFCQSLLVDENNLKKNSAEFVSQLSHNTEGVFYSDNSRKFNRQSSFWQMRRWYPQLYTDIHDLYNGNIMLGDLVIEDNSIQMKLDVSYGDELGDIYTSLTDSKFDKNVLKYIHEEHSAYFTYNVNLREAYETAYDIIIPMLESSDSRQVSSQLLLIEMMNEFLNKDAIFDTYKGSMFGTYNGIQKIKTKKLIFEYDEDTFEYTEREVEAEEDMPIFTLGFSTDRSDIPEKILKYIAKTEYECQDMGDYWVYDNAVLNAAPLYMILKNGLFIFSNDKDLAVNHADGYGSEALGKKDAKRAMKSGILYGYTDLGRAIENLPREIFNDEENEMIDVVRGKSGKVELTSTETTSSGTSFNLSYNYEGDYENTGTYILDLINSLYVVSK
jgi:hypothetical protein